MSGRGGGRVLPVAPTVRGAAQLVVAVALIAAGAAGGWFAPAAAGAALAGACVAGLAGVLLARGLRAGQRRAAGPLGSPERDEGGWARVDQHGSVIARPGRLPSERGLYRQRGVVLTWHDLFGFWRARRLEATGREVRVPPAADAALARLVASRRVARALDRSAETDPSGVRPYERGDGLRQISWRQTAHHGELMSLEGADGQAPPALVVADTPGARDADALAATACALLRALRPAPDVLLTDGLAVMRTPVQQERFLSALVADDEGAGGAGARARLVVRLAAGGAARRRVLLVTCDPGGPLAAALERGPLGRSVTVVEARAGGAPATAREGSPEGVGGDEATRARRAPSAPASLPCELLALPCCCALALLSMAPLLDMVRAGAWVAPVAALLGAGTALGCAAGSALAWRGARPALRAAVSAALAAALLAAGALVCARLLGGRPDVMAELGADPLDAARGLVATGVAQLGGQPYAEGGETWDLVILLGGTALAALCSALAATRPTRPAVALAAIGMAAADQSVMGRSMPAWAAAVCALALALAWLAAPRDRRPARAALAALLACALGAAGAAVAPADGALVPGLGVGTRVETLVDLSLDLQRRSSATALTYSTTADGPLYLRAAILDDFDGATWRASEEASLLDEPAGPGGGGVALAAAAVSTSVTTEGGSSPVPPGTTEVRSAGPRSYVATGTYDEPVSTVAEMDGLWQLVARAQIRRDGPGDREGLLAVGGDPGENVRDVLDAARADGADAAGGGPMEQLAVVRWLVWFFSTGGFSYSLEAPGGDGRDNFAVIDDLLAERSGYCTHYATAFSVLARLLGVPARVVIGYQPGGDALEDGSYEVTMRQLHAWSEAWVDGYGWVGADVTPAADDAADEPAEAPGAQVTPQAPEGTAEGAPEGGDPAPPEETGPADDPAPAPEEGATGGGDPPAWLAPALGGLGAACAAGAAAGLLLRARRRRLERGDWDYAWRRACRVARRHGVRWGRSATEQDVAEAICARLAGPSPARDVRRLARRACDARYGDGAGTGAGDGSWVPGALRALSRGLRRGGGR